MSTKEMYFSDAFNRTQLDHLITLIEERDDP